MSRSGSISLTSETGAVQGSDCSESSGQQRLAGRETLSAEQRRGSDEALPGAHCHPVVAFKHALIDAADAYFKAKKFGEDGELRATNFITELKKLDDKKLTTDKIEQAKLVLWYLGVIESTSVRLKEAVKKVSCPDGWEDRVERYDYYDHIAALGFMTKVKRLEYDPELFSDENTAIPALKRGFDTYCASLLVKRPQFDEGCLSLSADKSFVDSLIKIAETYLRNGHGGAEGKRRAANFIAALSVLNITEITEEISIPPAKKRALVVLLAGVVCDASDSTTLREMILESSQKLLKETVTSWAASLGISDYEIGRCAKRLAGNTLQTWFSPDLNDRLNRVVGRYIESMRKTTKMTDKTGYRRAMGFQAAIACCGEGDYIALWRIVYLLTKTTSEQLRDQVLAELGLPVYMLTNAVEIESEMEPFFGSFKTLSRRDADQAFMDDGITDAAVVAPTKVVREEMQPVISLYQALQTACAEYKKHKKPDAQGEARVRNLEYELLPQFADQSDKKYVKLACAVVFKSGSTDLAKHVLDKMFPNIKSMDEKKKALKRMQREHTISNYAAWLCAYEQINPIARVYDWPAFQHALLTAAKHYRLADLGGKEGKLRAQQCMNQLWILDPTAHEDQYKMVLIAYTLAHESGSTVLKNAMLDRLSERGLREADLKALAIHFGIVNQGWIFDSNSSAVKARKNSLERANYVFSSHPQMLENQLLFAADCVLAKSKDEKSRLKAQRLKEVVKTVMSAQQPQHDERARSEAPDAGESSVVLSDEEKKQQLYYLVQQVVADPDVVDLTQEIALTLLCRDAKDEKGVSYVALQSKRLSVSVERQQELKALLDNASAASALAGCSLFARKDERSEAPAAIAVDDIAVSWASVRDWQQLKNDFVLAVQQYSFMRSTMIHISSDGKRRADNLNKLLENIDLSKPGHDKRLMLLLSTIVLYSTSISMRLKHRVMAATGMSLERVKQLRQDYKIEADACTEIERRLVNAAREKIAVTDSAKLIDGFLLELKKLKPADPISQVRQVKLIDLLKSEKSIPAKMLYICSAMHYLQDTSLGCGLKAVVSDAEINWIEDHFLFTRGDYEVATVLEIDCLFDESWDKFKTSLVKAISAAQRGFDAGAVVEKMILANLQTQLLTINMATQEGVRSLLVYLTALVASKEASFIAVVYKLPAIVEMVEKIKIVAKARGVVVAELKPITEKLRCPLDEDVELSGVSVSVPGSVSS